jgi:glycosyltransferase involved in cell wall biosynthesis
MSNTTVSADRRNAADPLIPLGARSPTVAVVIPCYNEAVAIGKVVVDFRAALPDATVYVYDNNSTDCTIEQARAAGAVVRRAVRLRAGIPVVQEFIQARLVARLPTARLTTGFGVPVVQPGVRLGSARPQ